MNADNVETNGSIFELELKKMFHNAQLGITWTWDHEYS